MSIDSQPDQSPSGQSQPDQNQLDQSQPGQNKTGQYQPDLNKTGQNSKNQNGINQDLIRSELDNAIALFKVYLNNQKKNNHTYFNLSESSQQLIKQWGMPTESLMPKIKPMQNASFNDEGSESSDIFIIDSYGRFFKDESGELLIKILKAMNIASESVYICNAENLQLFKERVIKYSPRIIIALGTKSAQLLLDTNNSIHEIRGQQFTFHGINVMPTYHPSRLLKDTGLKRQVWEDMKVVMETIGHNNGS